MSHQFLKREEGLGGSDFCPGAFFIFKRGGYFLSTTCVWNGEKVKTGEVSGGALRGEAKLERREGERLWKRRAEVESFQ